MANTAASTLITRALDYMSRASAGTTRSGQTMENMAMSWLNSSLFRMSKVHDFGEMYKEYSGPTVASTKRYTFPDNWKVLLDIRLQDGSNSIKLRNKLTRLHDKQYPYPENDSENRPTWYIPFGNEFEVSPIPGEAYTMYIKTIQWPTVITATTDLIAYEPNKDDLVLALMLERGFSYLQMYTDKTEWAKEGGSLLKEAIRIELNTPDFDPVARGFDAYYNSDIPTDYYNNPFVWRNP